MRDALRIFLPSYLHISDACLWALRLRFSAVPLKEMVWTLNSKDDGAHLDVLLVPFHSRSRGPGYATWVCLRVAVCVCMYECNCVCLCDWACVGVIVCMSMSVTVYVHVYMAVCLSLYVCTWMYVYVRVWARIHEHMFEWLTRVSSINQPQNAENYSMKHTDDPE